jgi:hypothetical protein
VKILVDQSVPVDHRGVVRERVGAMLIPILRQHPQFDRLAVLVKHGPGGWDVAVLTLDHGLADLSPVPGVSADLVAALVETLRRSIR